MSAKSRVAGCAAVNNSSQLHTASSPIGCPMGGYKILDTRLEARTPRSGWSLAVNAVWLCKKHLVRRLCSVR
ncbi:hypothetical protein SERLADRAFT_465082 [Serpula lacrymans var. lacrymans S7.9]|uniref:Uncharacterized protein n=1 Tax=Serpula lacrymans var. lacrymans (strain S7.9) TaxID=578457 RepID=F8NUL6_SERL9|nr:uncharacterized protein SERLADRAFT_465082 [Serpula lacrymans var. lacrymans S7.9]EGO25236.1 hypothetical protein SERLADRAFT_465082 [Serpula lacrymans var. lacrymans S7.9]